MTIPALTAIERELLDLRALVAAALPPLPSDDRQALVELLPVLTPDTLMLAGEIADLASRMPGDAGARLREALAPYRDSDGGSRRLGRMLCRCRGRPVGRRFLIVEDLGGTAGLWYAVREAGSAGFWAEKPVAESVR